MRLIAPEPCAAARKLEAGRIIRRIERHAHEAQVHVRRDWLRIGLLARGSAGEECFAREEHFNAARAPKHPVPRDGIVCRAWGRVAEASGHREQEFSLAGRKGIEEPLLADNAPKGEVFLGGAGNVRRARAVAIDTLFFQSDAFPGKSAQKMLILGIKMPGNQTPGLCVLKEADLPPIRPLPGARNA